MNNEKIVKVCDVVIKIVNLVALIAQAVKAAFPFKTVSPEDAKIISDFMKEDIK